MPGRRMICAHCGSDAVGRDACASWDAESETWQLATVFDYAHCNACDGETTLRAQQFLADAAIDAAS